LVRIHTSLIERLSSAEDRMAEARAELVAGLACPADPTEREELALEQQRDNSARATLRDAIECFSGALKAAEAFDITDSLTDLFAGVRLAIRAETLAFNARVRAAGRKQVALPAGM